jgi:hypothetical protein
MSCLRALLVLVPMLSLLLVGCETVKPVRLANISCAYNFSDINRGEDQKRIDQAIRSVAVGEIAKNGTATHPEYRFVVRDLADLNKIHPAILFKNTGKDKDAGQLQTINAKNPAFTINYDSTDIVASMDTIMSFRVSPGSKLFYKPQGGAEMDITSKVDEAGVVKLQTKIRRGQEFIYARAVKDSVTRYIKINVFSQAVTDIAAKDY